jgi:predicted nucleotidyltransferase
MKDREFIRKEMKELLFERSEVIAVWEGGSVATGFDDEYSDLDLSIICEDDCVEAIYELITEYLDKNYGILNKYRVPEPTWHGFSQCYYQTENVPELFYFDIAFIKKSINEKFTESDRHGKSYVWFQKEEILDPTPTSEEKLRERSRIYYQKGTETFFLIDNAVLKYIKRNNFTEAFPAYYAFIARNLGIMLNLKYRPCKVDFGLLYGYRDYSKEDHKLIEDLLKVNNLEELSQKYETAKERYLVLKEELGHQWS